MILYQGYARELQSKIGRLADLVRHAPSVGNFHENIVSNYLENFISRRFSIKTGFVYNSQNGKTSSQIDILVIDENVPSAYLFQDKNFVVVIPESVVCAIEIKTNFDKSAFLDISKKAFDYRQANSVGFNIVALCFKSKVKDVSIISEWCKRIEITDNWLNYPKDIIILDDCILTSLPNPIAKPSGLLRIICNDEVREKDEARLTYFLFIVMKLCELKAGVNTAQTISTIFARDFDKLFTIQHKCVKYGNGAMEVDELNYPNGNSLYKREDIE